MIFLTGSPAAVSAPQSSGSALSVQIVMSSLAGEGSGLQARDLKEGNPDFDVQGKLFRIDLLGLAFVERVRIRRAVVDLARLAEAVLRWLPSSKSSFAPPETPRAHGVLPSSQSSGQRVRRSSSVARIRLRTSASSEVRPR